MRATVHLATLDACERVSQPELARAILAPVSFLAKVLQRLAARGFVAAVRGKDGGYYITEEGRAASLLDVVEAIEGPVLLNTCLSTGAPCERAGWCPAHLVWREAQQKMTEVLDSATIAQLARLEAARRPAASLDVQVMEQEPSRAGTARAARGTHRHRMESDE